MDYILGLVSLNLTSLGILHASDTYSLKCKYLIVICIKVT